jgi:2-oxoisovalerate dehydrogenase E2 component (dihydrolipoyl transacylase)
MPQLTMPNVGEGVTEGTVTRWLKAQGDEVALDEPVVEVETDKALVEVPSPYEGVLTAILVAAGEVVPIGAPLADIESAAHLTATPNSRAATKPPLVSAPASSARVDARRNGETEPRETTEGGAGGAYRRTRRYSPVVLRLAAEHDIDLSLVQGTGIEGRVTRQDVVAYIANPVAHTVPPERGAGVVGVQHAAAARRIREQPAAQDAREERAPLTPTRRTIAARMSQAHQTVPAAWMMVEADVTGLVALRSRVKSAFERAEGVPLTYMPFFVDAIVGALKQHPRLNSTFDDDAIVVHHRFDIGVAVAAEAGLVVPVLRDADRKSIAGLAYDLRELGEKAHARTLTVSDMSGATFTVDNTGAFGSISSQPIVPSGQAAIITTEVIRRELRVRGDESIAVRSLMNLCLSFDHRALDGAETGAFMQEVRRRLEAIGADDELW